MGIDKQVTETKKAKIRKFLTASEKIAKAKQELIKAQDKVKKLQEKRKLEIANLLFKLDEKIIDYDDNLLRGAFEQMLNKLNNEN